MTPPTSTDRTRVLHANDVLTRDEIRAFTRTADWPGWLSIAWSWARA